jgi:adenosylmethionine-8-amino-7-oxononanoate aminotransferase
MRRNVIVRALGPTTVAVCPPLVATPEQVAGFFAALDDALTEVRT